MTFTLKTKKTISDCADLVEKYNLHRAMGFDRFLYMFEIDGEHYIRDYPIYDFDIEMNSVDVLERLLKAENNLIKKKGLPYCPCKIDHSRDNVCPCIDCVDEIKVSKACCCYMYVIKGTKTHQEAQTVIEPEQPDSGATCQSVGLKEVLLNENT